MVHHVGHSPGFGDRLRMLSRDPTIAARL
jgi:hypothetical protein